jgi:hypothetical protein
MFGKTFFLKRPSNDKGAKKYVKTKKAVLITAIGAGLALSVAAQVTEHSGGIGWVPQRNAIRAKRNYRYGGGAFCVPEGAAGNLSPTVVPRLSLL